MAKLFNKLSWSKKSREEDLKKHEQEQEKIEHELEALQKVH